MKRCLLIILLLLTCSFSLKAEYVKSTIDTVISYQWGEVQNSGQSPEYFPANIFGRPDTAARADFQSSDPKQICSIGLDGEIVVSFKNFEIVDGPGPDFTVFENAFINPVTKKVFAEPGLVSVSEDGINFIDFPFDSATLEGCAGITPTNGDKDCFNPDVSGGDKFDLSDIGLSRAKYIRIRDITKIVLNNPEHYYYDPILSGFDLDAVVGLNLEEKQVLNVEQQQALSIITTNNLLKIENASSDALMMLYDLQGRLINKHKFANNIEEVVSQHGIYCLLILSGEKLIFRKVISI